MHSVLVPEGKAVAVGTPIAIMTESKEASRQLGNDYRPSAENVYSEEGSKMRTLIWQSYLKTDKGASDGTCS